MNLPNQKKINEALRRVFSKRPRLDIIEWLEKHFTIPSSDSPYPGKVKLRERTPYMIRILVVSTFANRMSLCFGSQAGKTMFLVMHNCWAIAQRALSAVFGFPNELLARSFAKTRLRPMFDSCEPVRKLKPLNDDNYATLEMQFQTMNLALVGAGSPTQAKSRPAGRIYQDEIDGFPDDTVNDEGSTEQLMEDRVKGRLKIGDYQILKTSTPSKPGRGIWRNFLRGTQEYYWMPCPNTKCGREFKFEESGLYPCVEASKKGGKEPDLEWIDKNAYYSCPHCGHKITDEVKEAMLSKGDDSGRWIAANDSPDPNHFSFHLNSFYPPFTTFKDLIFRYLASLVDSEAEKGWITGWLALPYSVQGTNDDADLYRKLEDEGRGEWEFPEGVKPGYLIATIDCQSDHVHASVWFVNLEGCWLLHYKAYLHPDEPYQIVAEKLAAQEFPDCVRDIFFYIDAGDQPEKVYDWCRAEGGRIPVMGVARGQIAPTLYVQPKPVDTLPDGKPDSQGLHRLNLNVQEVAEMFFKDAQRKLPLIHFYEGVPETWYDQLICEDRKVEVDKNGHEKVTWVNPKSHGDNHAMDLCRYMWAARSVWRMTFPLLDVAEAPPERPRPSESTHSGSSFWSR